MKQSAARQSSQTVSETPGGLPTGYLSIPHGEPPCKKKKEVFRKMAGIEKMQKYIERAKMDIKNPLQYSMNMREAFDLAKMAQTGSGLSIEAISMAFNYGQAKGYRAAKAERRAAV